MEIKICKVFAGDEYLGVMELQNKPLTKDNADKGRGILWLKVFVTFKKHTSSSILLGMRYLSTRIFDVSLNNFPQNIMSKYCNV